MTETDFALFCLGGESLRDDPWRKSTANERCRAEMLTLVNPNRAACSRLLNEVTPQGPHETDEPNDDNEHRRPKRTAKDTLAEDPLLK